MTSGIYIRTKEHRKRLSEFHIGQKAWNKDKHWSEETKRKISESGKGKHHFNIGCFKKGHKKLDKAYSFQIGHFVLEDTRKKISDANKGQIPWITGRHHSEESIRKMKENHKGMIGKNHSGETKQKMRLSAIKYIKIICNGIRPNLGHSEKKILDNLEETIFHKIIRQYEVKGYFLDGYIPELQLAIEVDEKHHNYRSKKDIKRQQEIEKELNCKFIRIKGYD